MAASLKTASRLPEKRAPICGAPPRALLWGGGCLQSLWTSRPSCKMGSGPCPTHTTLSFQEELMEVKIDAAQGRWLKGGAWVEHSCRPGCRAVRSCNGGG